jgi:hypothetical protein
MAMTKQEAISKWVDEMSAVPDDWIRAVAEVLDGATFTTPMWGTMFLVNEFDGEKFWDNSRVMVSEKEEIDLDQIEEKEGEQRRKEVEKAIEADDWSVFEEYLDEEMAYERNVLDKDGRPTAAYIYEVAGVYVIGVNGAGWDFYDGVWDRLYDATGLHWHSEEK